MAAEKKDRALGQEELDYDSLLSHYRDASEPETPPPPREKKKLISTLLSDVSAPSEGKFARKRTPKNPPQEKIQEEESPSPIPLEELKPAPRPQEGQKRWDRILREPVRQEPEEPAPELSQVLETLEEGASQPEPREHLKKEKPPKREKPPKAERAAKADPPPRPAPEIGRAHV